MRPSEASRDRWLKREGTVISKYRGRVPCRYASGVRHIRYLCFCILADCRHMRKLHLKHFRCYSDLCIDLKPGINLLVGDNASGKTSLIKACQYALGAFFAGFSDENTQWKGFDEDDFQRTFGGDKQLPSEAIQIVFDPTDLIQTLTPGDCDIERESLTSQVLERRTIKGARALRTGLKSYIAYAHGLYESLKQSEKAQVNPLPLFTCYSVEDIHTKRRIDDKAFRGLKPKHSLGYLGCLDGDGLFRYWVMRLLILAERERDTNGEELEFIRQSVLRFVGESGCGLFVDLKVFPISKEVIFEGLDGRKTPTDYLSEGQKRIVAMALDLAFRSYHLNYMLYREKTCDSITGTVLIDEVDMHLHPSLQAKVLPALRRAYPRVQFIASSHAPMVMSGVESNDENVVYKLFYGKEVKSADELKSDVYPPLDSEETMDRRWRGDAKYGDDLFSQMEEEVETDDISGFEQSPAVENLREGEGDVLSYQLEKVCTYGVDLSSLVEQLWGLVPRSERVNNELKELFCLIRDKEHSKAKEMLQELQDKYPDIPDLTRAEVMLRLLSSKISYDTDNQESMPEGTQKVF